MENEMLSDEFFDEVRYLKKMVTSLNNDQSAENDEILSVFNRLDKVMEILSEPGTHNLSRNIGMMLLPTLEELQLLTDKFCMQIMETSYMNAKKKLDIHMQDCVSK